jgi:hypothetical protein
MSQSHSQPPPEEGIADALSDLSGQTRALVRREVESAQAEMWAKAKAAAPAVALLALSATLGLAAAASAYRWNLRMLEKALPPSAAALMAVLAYGGAAAWTGSMGLQRLRQLPAPVPTDTVRATADTLDSLARA